MRLRCVAPVAAALLCFAAQAQTRSVAPFGSELQAKNDQIVAAWLHHDFTALGRMYAADAVLMPEFHQTLFGRQAINEYLREWMNSVTVSSYTRASYEVIRSGDYLIETGTFRNRYTKQNQRVDYQGKFLAVWRIEAHGHLALVWEATGSVRPIDRNELPASTLQVPDRTDWPSPVPGKTAHTIQQLDDQVARLVVERRGDRFGAYYTDDAIYMPYYMPMQVGKPAIEAYYREHEDPATKIDGTVIRTAGIIETGGLVLTYAWYQVDWRGDTSHGSVTGKNITIWQRQPDDRLLVFRQMAVHD